MITSIGTGVDGLQVSDRVVGLGKHGISTSLITTVSNIARVPDDLDLAEVVTLLIPFAMAIYALKHVTALTEKQSILIHSACSDIGVAAIQLSQSIGAEVGSSLVFV